MGRASGVLMHISSLPNQFGIGSFGKSAYDFIDFLVETKQSYWQILPLTTTGYGDSPYQSFSAFAGNTHFIDFDLLAEAGYLNKEDYANIDFGSQDDKVDYGKIYEARRPILEKAVDNFMSKAVDLVYWDFTMTNQRWLEPFCEFMAIKEYFNHAPWYEWDEDIKLRKPKAIAQYTEKLSEKINYHFVTQFFFQQQWAKLKKYANERHIQIIGDLPIYVSLDSVEMWYTPELFKTDKNKMPTFVAATPPDAFSEDGQYWGNPIYDWDKMKEDNFEWWIWRFKESLKRYDVIRLDHFRGFESFWEVEYGSKTAADGHWTKGPDYEFFKVIENNVNKLNIIAEDLGVITEDVRKMHKSTGYPGMNVLQFAFDQTDNPYLPHNYVYNSVAYVGTHDNETVTGWYNSSISDKTRKQIDEYLVRGKDESPAMMMNRGIASSHSKLAIYSMQDLLELDNDARMNHPSTMGDNWKWRMIENQITEKIKNNLVTLTDRYFRSNPNVIAK